MEAKGVDASMLNRRCVFIRWTELSLEKFLDLIERGAGAMVILLPPNMQEVEEDVLKVLLGANMDITVLASTFSVDDLYLKRYHVGGGGGGRIGKLFP
jgi:hypothetical protein